MYYFLTHPFLYPLLRARLLPCFLLTIFIYANLFIWTYLPQVAFLSIWHRQLAWFNATVLVLGEGAAIVALLFEAFFVDETQVDVFDSVLINEGYEDLITGVRVINSEEEDPVKKLGKPQGGAIYAPFSLRQIVEFVVLLPLNFIPVGGTVAFVVLTGYRAGPLQHWRYFRLLDFNKKERNAFVKTRKLTYTWFGSVALMLQLVPGLSMLFLLTTAAGSALWAAQMERQRRAFEEVAAPGEEFRDDPV